MRFLVRVLSVLFGLAVAALGLAMLVGVGWLWLRPGDPTVTRVLAPVRRGLEHLTWSSTPVLVTAWIVAVAGLLLLLIALAAGRRDVRLEDPAPEMVVTTSPRSVARLVGHRVRATDGVSGAVVTASRKSVRVKANSRLLTPGELRPQVLAVATEAVGSLPIPSAPRVSVSVHSAKEKR